MASIEERKQRSGGSSWRVSWRLDGKRDGKWQSLTLGTEKEAIKAMALAKAHGHAVTRQQLAALLAPTTPKAGETVAELCTRYVESLHIEGGTRKEYERSIRLHIAPTSLGRADVASVTRDDVRRWIQAEAKTGAAPKSIANHHGLLFAAFSEAINEGMISIHPCRGVRLPRRDVRIDANDEMCFLTPFEVKLIAETLPKKYRHIPWLLARTGLRWSELTALQVGDVDLMGAPPRLSVRRAWKRQHEGGWKLGPPKTAMSRRTISLDAACFEILLPLCSGRSKTDFVITTVGGSKPLPHSTFQRQWQRALYGPAKTKDGGLIGNGLLDKRPSIHDLRHTHASWMLDDPMITMIRVQRRLGHESLLTTEKVYGHLRQDGDEAIIAALDAVPV